MRWKCDLRKILATLYILDLYIMGVCNNPMSVAWVHGYFKLRIQSLTGSITCNIFGSRLTCSGLKLNLNLTTSTLGVKTTCSTTRVNLNQANPVNGDGWMSCGSIITTAGMWSGTGLCISGVPVVTEPFQASLLVRLPMGWLGICIWSILGLQRMLPCAVDLTHVKMWAMG